MAYAGLLILTGTVVFFSFPYLIVKYGIKSLYVIIPYAVIAAAVTAGNFSLLATALTPIILGATGGYVFLKKKNFQFFIIVSAVLIASVNIFQYHYMTEVMNYDLGIELRKTAEQFFDMQKVTDEKKTEVLRDLDYATIFYSENVYFLNFASAILVSLITLALYRLMFLIVQSGVARIEGIEMFRLNDYIIFLFIVFLAGTAFIREDTVLPLLDTEKAALFARNGLMIVSLLYLLQAIGVFKFFIIKKRVPPVVLPLALLTLIVMGRTVTLFVSILLAGVGLLDMWADFRKLDTNEGDDPAEN